MNTKTRETTDDLDRVDGKAEVVGGEVVTMSPTGGLPGWAGDLIFASLLEHRRRTKVGWPVSDNKAFRVDLPGRGSFSPDAAYYFGDPPSMDFYDGAPAFAAEVRSRGDYGPAAEISLAEKRRDYFAAGTLVVWDVDLLSDDVVRVHRANTPGVVTVYHRGESAEAEPAVPGWSMPVDDMFA